MTPRQARLADAATAINNAAIAMEADFPRAEIDDPMVPAMRRELVQIRQRDVASLRLGSKTVMAIAEDPDAYGLLMQLRAEKPADFAAIMVLVKIELERPALAEQAVAA